MSTLSQQGRDKVFRRPLLALAAAISVAAMLAACATSGAIHAGRSAEDRGDFDTAVLEYSRALKLDPNNADARTGLERARIRASQDHFTRARRAAATGKLQDAVAEYQLAAELNPQNAQITQELKEAENQLRTKVPVARNGKTELEALVDRMRDQPTPGLEMPQAAPLPESLTFRNASSQDVITALARLAKVNVVFDPAFRATPLSIDLRDMTFDQALSSITSSTQNFFRVTAPRTITVIPDTPAKRREYEEEIVRTFYLSNADLRETMDLLRIVIDARRIGSVAGANAITIHDTSDRINAAGRLISMIDKARPEVLIDVELLEVNRSKLNEYGLQFASPGSPGINGVADVNRTGLTLDDVRNLTDSQVLMTGVPGLYYRLIKSDTATRVLANPQLRTQVGIAAQARFGERVPVPVTIFAPIATGGVAQQPITSFNYENIGVNIDITPRTHMDNDVTLALKISVTSISGTGFGGLPTFGNREINTQIRLRDGETNMLAGLIRDDERKLREGMPGITDLPAIGHLFGHTKNERTQTDVILMLTPRIVRVLELEEADLRAFQMGSNIDTGGGFAAPVTETPVPQPVPVPPPTQTPQPAAPAPGTPQPVQPVLPPAPTTPTIPPQR